MIGQFKTDRSKCSFILLAFFLICLLCFSSVNAVTFEKWFGDVGTERGYSVAQTADQGYIIVGYTYLGGTTWLIKTDSLGDTLWTKKIVESGGTRGECYSVAQTADLGYILAGTLKEGWTRCWLVKTDSLGETLWSKYWGDIYIDDGGQSVAQTNDLGYIVTGWTKSYGAGSTDVWLIKTDSLGDTLWTKTFGGFSGDYGKSVAQTSDLGYIITGYTESYGAGNEDVYLIKTDSLGDTLWTKTFGSSSSYEYGQSVAQTDDSGYIITGRGFGDVWLIKTDSNGDTVWTKTFGGSYGESGYSVAQTTDLGYIIAGYILFYYGGKFHTDVYLIKTDSNGDSLWTKTFGEFEDDLGRSVAQTSDLGYIITGSTESYGAGNGDVYLIKTDSLGNIGVEEEPKNSLNQFKIPGFVCGNILKFSDIKKTLNVQIFDIIGRGVFSQTVTPQKPHLNLNNLTSGIYFLSIKEQTSALHKFVLIK